LLLASFYAAANHQLQIVPVIGCAALWAILGDNIVYTVGRSGGRPFVKRFGRYLLLKPQHLDKAEKFFARHGGKTVFFGRFIAVLRAWSAFLAGVNRMRWTKFLLYNAAGGIAWSTIIGLFAYYAGKIIGNNFAEVERLGQSLGFIGLALLVLPVAYFIVRAYLRKRRRAREAALAEAVAQEEPAAPVK
jgi:membrane protein DedA with SNARE-associated domain